jgi:cytochrome-b5 reductase
MIESLTECTILSKEQKNHNVIKLRLGPATEISPPAPSFFVFVYPDPARELFRPYSPLQCTDNTIELLIKIYEHGEVSRLIGRKGVGDSLYLSGFKRKLEYQPDTYGSVLMIAGGTGVTPLIQILNDDCRRGSRTHFTLLLCNSTEDDIFGMEEIAACGDRVRLVHVISKLENEKNNFVKGRIGLSTIQAAARNGMFDFVYVCGPPGMMEAVSGDKNEDKTQGTLRGLLAILGYASENVYKL